MCHTMRLENECMLGFWTIPGNIFQRELLHCQHIYQIG